MKDSLRILHLEDQENDAALVRMKLNEVYGPRCRVRWVKSEQEFTDAIDHEKLDVVLSDSSGLDFDGLSALEMTRRKRHALPFIFVCGGQRAVQGEKMIAAGAADYVEKGTLRDLPLAIERALRDQPSGHVPVEQVLTPPAEMLINVVQQLSLARNIETVQAIVRRAARELMKADGATFVLREGDLCYYADEDAISPLWKGCRFPMSACISGWAMLNRREAVIEDIYADPRIPHDAYRPTFVKSLIMVPIRRSAPIGAIGGYWALRHHATEAEVRLLQALADSASIAIENVQLYSGLEQRVQQRTAELEAVNQDLEAFSYSVSHDLRAPIRGIDGCMHLLRMKYGQELSPEVHGFLGRIAEQTTRMQEIIEALLSLARIGRAPLERTAVNLAEISREIAAILQTTSQDRQVEWVIPESLIVDGDPALLRAVMENLLGNAWKYSSKREHTRIQVGTSDIEGKPTIFVRDNGAGFDPKYAGKLFGAFQRLHHQSEFPGTGVGLANVQRIVQKHGGRIWAESAVDRGATFFFTLS